MTQILIVVSVWLHTLATVIFIGHYVLLSIIYLPVLPNSSGTILSGISRRSRPWLYASLVIFALSGVYLTISDPNYLGLGNFGNPWGILMLIKHVLILGMIGLGFWFNAIMRVGPMMSSNTNAENAIRRFRMYSNGMAVSGILVLLLTALAQLY